MRRDSIISVFVLVCVILLYWFMMSVVLAHDLAAWEDPVRGDWYRSLQVPPKAGRISISCCNWDDVNALDPDKVLQDTFGQWWVDLGQGYVKVPPDRVVKSPTSIDGLPYVFLMLDLMPDNPGRIRCFVPPIPTY